MNTNDRFFSDWTSSASNHSRSQSSHNMNPHTNFNQSSMYSLSSQWNMTSPHGQGNMPGSNPLSSMVLNPTLQHGRGLSYNPIMPYSNTSNSSYPGMHPSMNIPSGGSQNQFAMTETVQRGRDVMPSFPSMGSTHSPYLSQNDSSTMQDFSAYRYNSASDPLNTNRLMHSDFMTTERRSLSRTGSNTSALDPSAQMGFPLEQTQISSGSRSHLGTDSGFMSRSQQPFELPTRSDGMGFARSDYSSHMTAAGRSFGGLAHASSRQTEIPMSYAATSSRTGSSVAAASMEKSMPSNQSFWSSQPTNTPSLPVTETSMSSQREKTPYFPVTQSLPGSAPVPRGGYGGGTSYSSSRATGQGSGGSNVASPQSSYSNTPSMAAAAVTTASSYSTTSSARSQTAYSHMSPATTSAPSTPLGSAPPTTTASSIMPSSKSQTEQESTSMPGSNQSYSMAPRTPATPSFTSGYSPTFTTATTATTTMSPYTAPRSNDSVTSGNYRGPSSVQSTASNHSAAIKQKTQINTSPLQDTHVSDGIKGDIPMQTEILKQQATPEKMSPDDGASGLPPFTDVIQTLENTISRLPQASPGQSSEIQQAMRQLKLLMSVHSMMDATLKDDSSIQQEQSSTDKREAQSSSENSEDEQREEMLFKEGVRRPVDLPRELTLKIDEQLQISVWAKQEIPVDTEFGPYQGRLTNKFVPADTRDKWLVMGPDYNSLALLQPLDDLEAELPPNWLRYISPASSYQDQNCMLVKTEENTRYMIKVVRDIGPNQELFAIHNEEFASPEPEEEEEEEDTTSQEMLDIPDQLDERSEERRPSDSSMPRLDPEEDREISAAILPEAYDSSEEFSRKRELSDDEEDIVEEEEEEEEEESPRKSKRRKLLAAEPDVPADIGMIDPNDIILPEEPKEEKPKRKSRKKKKEAPPSEREESASASESRTPSPVKSDRKRRSRRDKSKGEDTEEKAESPEKEDSPPPTPHFEKKKEKKRAQKSESPDKKEAVKRKRQREASAESKAASDRESEPEASEDEKVKSKGKKDKDKEKEDSDKRVKRKWTHREFTCEVCGETIRYVTKFDRHMMEKHGINEPWKCEHCPTERKFRLYATLEKHILTIHPDISFSYEKSDTPVEKKQTGGEKEAKVKRTRKSKKSKGELNDVTPTKEKEEDKEDDRKSDSDLETPSDKSKYQLEMAELHQNVKHLKSKDKRDSSSERKKGTKSGSEKKRKKSKKDKAVSSQGEPSQDESEESNKKANSEVLPEEDDDSEVMRKLSFGQENETLVTLDKGNDSNSNSDEDSSPLSKLRSDDRDARPAIVETKESNTPLPKVRNADDKVDYDDSDDGDKEEKGDKSLLDASAKKKRKHRKLTFTCEDCDETFKWTTKYMKHMSEMHGVTKPFKCEKCNDISFGTYQNYERHCQSKHDPNNSSSSRRAWTKHHFKCEVCGENIIHATKFDKHMFEKHGVVKPWKCNQCDQAFRLLSSLRNHINYVHEQIARPKSGKSRDSTLSTPKKELVNADKGQAYELDILEEMNKGKAAEIDDEPLVKKDEDETDVDNGNTSHNECNDTNDDATSDLNKKKKKGSYKKSGTKKYMSRQFTCHLCQETITSVTGFEKHMLDEHKVDNCWQCKRCSTAPFRLFNGLQQHMKNMHTSDQESKTVLCELCGRSFKSEENLKRHMRVHLEMLPFLCSFCDKSFGSQSQLQMHLDKDHVTHPDAFKCDKCLKVHTSQEQLDNHREKDECSFTSLQFGELKTDGSTVLYREGRERVQCSHCDQMVLKQDYEDHVNTHTGNKPHECNECGRGFAHRAGLNSHLKQVHSGEKNYKCDICGKAFKLKSYLRQHMVTHSSEKPHVCSICGKGFTRKAFMKKHERRHQESKEGEDDKEDGKDEEEEEHKEQEDKKDEKDDKSAEGGKDDDGDDKSEEHADEENDESETTEK
ncbi:uncharacterized protein [Ptychodera flava]|uniref:uncharacterized protein n=1 Tax=Ptychodera flava TaxID=63121 RepID=UPI003969DC7C